MVSRADSTLFDPDADRRSGPRTATESSFAFLNHSSRPTIAILRDVLELWFASMPASCRKDVRARFRSRKDSEHHGALLELLVHEVLLGAGCRVVVHPRLNGRHRPDFLVHRGDSDAFFVECRSVSPSKSEQGAARRTTAAIQSLDDLDSPNFYLDVQQYGPPPATTPPTRRLRAFVRRWLNELHDWTGLLRATTQWEHDGWSLKITAVRRRTTGGSPNVLMQSADVRESHAARQLRSALKKKRGYDVSRPLLLVLGAQMELLSEDDVLDALLGDVVGQVTVADGLLTSRFVRVAPSAFGFRGLPRSTRLSAVLVWGEPFPLSPDHGLVKLYDNPGASNPIDLSWLPVDQLRWAPDGRPRPRSGSGLRGCLRLPSAWTWIRPRTRKRQPRAEA